MLDFSAYLYEFWLLLNDKRSKALSELRSQIKYIMVDEYQDTNRIQEDIVRLLAGDTCNVCVVGDDDQGLYRFRGADINGFLHFPDLFPGKTCTDITLNINYRSTKKIVEFYEKWMSEERECSLQ